MSNTPLNRRNLDSQSEYNYQKYASATSKLWLVHRRGVLFAIALALIYVLPLILVDQYVDDDTTRIVTGAQWPQLGRFWTEYLAQLTSISRPEILNIFPFSLILSAVMLGVAGYIVSYVLGIESRSSYRWSSVILIASPFLLSNLSYRYDAPSMALSQLVVILPFCFIRRPLLFFITGILGIYFSLGLYQATALTWVAMWLCLALSQILNQDWRKFLLDGAAAVFAPICAFLLYLLTLRFIGDGVPERAGTILKEPDFWALLQARLEHFQQLLMDDFIYEPLQYVLELFVVLTVIGALVLIYKDRLFKKPLTLITAIVLVPVGAVGILLLTGFLNIFLTTSWWALRVMLSLPFLIYFLLVLQKALPLWVIRLSIVCICYPCFVIGTVYAQALKNRTEHNDYLINLVAPYMEDKDTRHVLIVGMQPAAPRNELILTRHPINQVLVWNMLNDRVIFGDYVLQQYTHKGNLTPVDVSVAEQLKESRCSIPVVKEYHDMTLRKQDHTLIVDFNGDKGCGG